jgi:hypothetical protein
MSPRGLTAENQFSPKRSPLSSTTGVCPSALHGVPRGGKAAHGALVREVNLGAHPLRQPAQLRKRALEIRLQFSRILFVTSGDRALGRQPHLLQHTADRALAQCPPVLLIEHQPDKAHPPETEGELRLAEVSKRDGLRRPRQDFPADLARPSAAAPFARKLETIRQRSPSPQLVQSLSLMGRASSRPTICT